MAKLCNSCGGAVCQTCGGCINHGECSCMYDAVDERLVSFKEQAATIEQKLEEAASLLVPIFKDDQLALVEELVRDSLQAIREVQQELTCKVGEEISQ